MLLGFFTQEVNLVFCCVMLQQSMVDAFGKVQCTECRCFERRERIGQISFSFIDNDTPLRLCVTGGHVLISSRAHRGLSLEGDECIDIPGRTLDDPEQQGELTDFVHDYILSTIADFHGVMDDLADQLLLSLSVKIKILARLLRLFQNNELMIMTRFACIEANSTPRLKDGTLSWGRSQWYI